MRVCQADPDRLMPISAPSSVSCDIDPIMPSAWRVPRIAGAEPDAVWDSLVNSPLAQKKLPRPERRAKRYRLTGSSGDQAEPVFQNVGTGNVERYFLRSGMLRIYALSGWRVKKLFHDKIRRGDSILLEVDKSSVA